MLQPISGWSNETTGQQELIGVIIDAHLPSKYMLITDTVLISTLIVLSSSLPYDSASASFRVILSKRALDCTCHSCGMPLDLGTPKNCNEGSMTEPCSCLLNTCTCQEGLTLQKRMESPFSCFNPMNAEDQSNESPADNHPNEERPDGYDDLAIVMSDPDMPDPFANFQIPDELQPSAEEGPTANWVPSQNLVDGLEVKLNERTFVCDSYAGKGVSGLVYKGYEMIDGERVPVAIKQSKASISDEAFDREIEMTNYAGMLIEAGWVDGVGDVMISKWVDGTSLMDILHDRWEQPSLETVEAHIQGVLDSLRALHEDKGIYHGDPNPGNVMVKKNSDGTYSYTWIDYADSAQLVESEGVDPEDIKAAKDYDMRIAEWFVKANAKYHYPDLGPRPTS